MNLEVQDYCFLAVSFIAALGWLLWGLERLTWHFAEKRWEAERNKLLDRIQARDLREYKALETKPLAKKQDTSAARPPPGGEAQVSYAEAQEGERGLMGE